PLPPTAGCPAGAVFNYMTSAPCVPSNVPGCPAGAMFNYLTGASCSGASFPGQGGVGDVNVDQTSSGTDSEVTENDDDVPVLGFDIDAEGSDIDVTSVRVEFVYDGATTGSDNLDRYVDQVSILMEGDVVGTIDVDEFNEDNDIYSANISISNATIQENESARFHVAVTSVNNVDSDDLGEPWVVGLGQIRFEDRSGAILTDNTGNGVNVDGAGVVTGDISEVFSFEDLSSSGDIRLRVNEDDDSINNAHTVQIDNSGDTNDVEILSFTLEAEGSDITLNSIPFDINSFGAGVTEIASDFRLLMDGDEVGDVTIDAGGFAPSADTSRRVTITNLDDDDVIIDADGSATFTLLADINEIGGTLGNGDSFTSVLLNSDLIDADDENGDGVDITDLTGTAESNDISFASTGITISVGAADPSCTSTSCIDNNGTSQDATDDRGVFVINFDVEAFDDPAYIALTGASSTDSTFPLDIVAGAFAFVENANTNAALGTGVTTVSLDRTSGGSETTAGGVTYAKINAGQTASFRLTVYHNAAVADILTRGQLQAINFAATAVPATLQQLALPTEDYQSASIIIPN
ncbi:MAG: hypothetical protein ABI430_02310, partial [Candidatus Taylorbacteria bacterium]